MNRTSDQQTKLLWQPLPGDWRESQIRYESIAKIWGLRTSSTSRWLLDVTATKETLNNMLHGGELLIESSYGMLWFTEIHEGHYAQVHGLFWGREVMRKHEELRALATSIMRQLFLLRLEVLVVDNVKGVRRLLSKVGFSFEGRLKKYFRNNNLFYDCYVYAIVNEEA